MEEVLMKETMCQEIDRGYPMFMISQCMALGSFLKSFPTLQWITEENFGSYSADPSGAELQQSFITAALSNILDEDKLSDEETGSQEEDERSEYRAEDISIEPGNGMFIANFNSKSRTVDVVPSERDSGMKSDGSMATSQDNEWFPWPNKLHQVDLLTWILDVNGVQDVPSVKTLKTLEDGLQKICGIETLPFTGAFGHKYYMNSFSDIICQEMANPHDLGKKLNEAFQARRWLKEMDPTQIKTFIFEPTLLSSGQACMPIRWFQCEGLFFAMAWPLQAAANDMGCGWIVEGYTEIEISQRDLLVSFKNWGISQSTSMLPPTHNIIGIKRSCQGGLPLEPWLLTNPHEGNPWHVHAKGAHVYSFPIWLYCDDTSGNLSKQWNKHNSFLFTPAGLPHAAVHQEYNVHFLCTSNTASPLEMLDGFVNQLETAQETGIWAWDCVHKEKILVFPSVLALLGDNPMQSELSCHVGSMGKYFCCVCNVKGHDAQAMTNNEDNQAHEQSDGVQSDGQRSIRSEGEETVHIRKGKKKETMSGMVSCIKQFVKQEQSITELKSMFTMASSIGNQSKIKEKKTATGLKDTYLEYFLEEMAASYKKKHGGNSKQQALDEFIQGLPGNVYSPVWCIKGLDPHSDTPVEVLHTVLLGFVKYFWRDVLLEACLSSFDTTGLGIPPLSGHTLVQYAGSLVGLAPLVLHDLVPQECYNVWIALSRIIPLIWQPEIEGVDAHLTLLEAAIQNFLAYTACWTPCWFNKSKFHIILHLVGHIHWFGPAALFATEAFESFNAVICSKSIHSNQQSPSHDIAKAFAHGHQIHHILSGAHLPIHSDHPKLGNQIKKLIERPHPDALNTDEAGVWWPPSTAPLTLVSKPNIVTDYLGLDDSSMSKKGLSMILMNGNKCVPGQWVLIHPQNSPQPFVAQVKEIIQRKGSTAEATSFPDAILLQAGKIQGSCELHQMPVV
ncbi:hypothetical protein V8B97DRAFT_2021242 [Scleroderma yunnanense]